MATPSRKNDPDVNRSTLRLLLEHDPCTFQFFQAVRLLHRIYPSRRPVGRYGHPSAEIVRFGAYHHYAFPASQIQELRFQENGPPLMIVNFMGLTGPKGLMPLYYTALLMERVRAKDYGLRDFLDIFNHRMISLFYQAWEKYRFTVAYERGERDRFSHHLLDLLGLGTPKLQNRMAVQDDSLLFYSGLLSLHPRSATALRQILWDYFEAPVEVEQFVGAWYALDPETQCRFEDGTRYSEQLGVGAIVGDEIWDQNSGVRIRLGPLSLEQYLDFLPNGSAYQPLRSLVKFYSSNLDFEVQLILKRGEVPPCELGAENEVAPQLGWLSWAKNVPMQRDPGETILRI
jgi:type VI secretion system protein ImpH